MSTAISFCVSGKYLRNFYVIYVNAIRSLFPVDDDLEIVASARINTDVRKTLGLLVAISLCYIKIGSFRYSTNSSGG